MNSVSAYSPHPRAEFAWINHYIMKSAEEFVLRRSQPRGDMPSSTAGPLSVFTAEHVRWFRSVYEAVSDVEDSRIAQCCPDFDAQLAWLGELPGVAAARHAVGQAFEEHRSALGRLLATSDRFAAVDTDEGWFGSLMRTDAAVPQ